MRSDSSSRSFEVALGEGLAEHLLSPAEVAVLTR